MAKFKSDIIAAKDAVKLSDKSLLGQRTGSLVLFATCIYTTLGTEAVNDTVDLCDIPPDCEVMPHLSSISHDGTGATALTWNVGDAGDADRFGAGIASQSGTAGTAFLQGGVAAVAPYRNTSNLRVVAAVATKTGTITAGKKVVFVIAYRPKG